MTKPLIRLLLPHAKPTTSTTSILSESTSPKSVIVPLLGQDSEADLSGHEVRRPASIRDLLTTPTHTVHRYWRKFDNAFMRPVFGGRGFVPFVPGSPTERNNTQWQWVEQMWKKVCKLCISRYAGLQFRIWLFYELLGYISCVYPDKLTM